MMEPPDLFEADEEEALLYTLLHSEDEIDQQALAAITKYREKADLGWSIASGSLARVRQLIEAVECVLDHTEPPDWLERNLRLIPAYIKGEVTNKRLN